MCFDFIVLVLNAYKLVGSSLGSSKIAKMIFEDGLIFFIIAYVFFLDVSFLSGLTVM